MATCVDLWRSSASAQALRLPAAVGVLTMTCARLTGRVLLTTAMGFLLDTVSSCQLLVVLHDRRRLINGRQSYREGRAGQECCYYYSENAFPGSFSSLKEL